MADFARHIEPLIEKEGGYRLTDIPGDRGGQTYAGISRRSNPDWAGWAFIDRGAGVPREHVHQLYRERYWDPVRGDDIKDYDVAEILLSSAVLSGPPVATALAQDAVDVKVDCHFGPRTLAAVNAIDPKLFETRFALARIGRFAFIANRDPSQRKFFLGWVNRVFREAQT